MNSEEFRGSSGFTSELLVIAQALANDLNDRNCRNVESLDKPFGHEFKTDD